MAKSYKKAEYAYISINRAIKIVERVLNKFGDVIPSDSISGLVGYKGGALAHVLTSLKLYGLLDKLTRSEYKITDLGKSIVKSGSKKEIFESFLLVGIHRDVYKKYAGTTPHKKVITSYLTREGIDPKEAVKIAGIFLRGLEFINSMEGGAVETVDNKEKQTNKSKIDKDTYNMIYIISSLSIPEEPEDITTAVDNLLKLAEKHNMHKFYGMIKGIQMAHKDTPEDIRKIFKSSAKEIMKVFEQDLGVA